MAKNVETDCRISYVHKPNTNLTDVPNDQKESLKFFVLIQSNHKNISSYLPTKVYLFMFTVVHNQTQSRHRDINRQNPSFPVLPTR